MPVHLYPATEVSRGAHEIESGEEATGVGPQQGEVRGPWALVVSGVEIELQLAAWGLSVEGAQAVGGGGGEFAVVGAPDPEYVGLGAQDQPAHRQPQVAGADIGELQLSDPLLVRQLVGVDPPGLESLHRFPADELVVEVPVGGWVPVVCGVDGGAHRDPGG